MKKNSFTAFAMVAVLSLSTALQVHAATQTLEGVISDSMCGKKHMMPGKSDAECTKECVKAGAKYVLVVGDKIFTLNGKPAVIEQFAGKHVQVKGDVKQSTIDVSDIHEASSMSHAGMKM